MSTRPPFDLKAICKPPPTETFVYKPQPIYRFDDYIALYERVCKEQGYEFDASKFDPEVYKCEPPPPVVEPEKFDFGAFGDRAIVHLDVDEDDNITVAVDTVLNDLWSKSWGMGKQPPLNDLVVTFKKLGADDSFLKKIIKRHDRIRSVCKNFDLDKAFKPKSKPKKKKQKQKEVEEAPKDDIVEEREEEEEEEDEEEFEGMDVEDNEEDDECQGEDDEEYIDTEE